MNGDSFSDMGVWTSAIKLAISSTESGGANFHHCWFEYSVYSLLRDNIAQAYNLIASNKCVWVNRVCVENAYD